MGNYMFKKYFILLVFGTVNMLLTGCMSLSEKLYELRQHAQQEHQERHLAALNQANEEREKNERKKLLELFLKSVPKESSDPTVQALVGEHTGSTCNGKNNVALNISYLYTYPFGSPNPTLYVMYGKLRMNDPNGRNAETYIKGIVRSQDSFYPNGAEEYKGMVIIESIKQPTLREFVKLITGKDDDHTVQKVTDDLTEDKNLHDAFKKMFEIVNLKDDDTKTNLDIAVRMSLVGDTAGTGWVGSFVAKNFEDCHEITMINMAGKSTAMFLPFNSTTALRFLSETKELDSNPVLKTNALSLQQLKPVLKNKIYWCKVAEKLGFSEVDIKHGVDNVMLFDTMADTYMKMAQQFTQSSTQYYQLAREYYLKNANTVGDARAHLALERLYRQGLGTPVNTKEADKWQALANKTYAQATKMCSSPNMVREINEILAGQDQRGAIMGGFFGAMTSVDVSFGRSQIVAVRAENVSTPDRLFECLVVTKTIGAGADASGVPNYIEYTDRFGRTYYQDRMLEKGLLSFGANFLDKALNNRLHQMTLRLYPLGDKKYKINNKYEVDLR